MAIVFECACGKSLRAKDSLAGKRTKCPECEAILTIPSVAPQPPDEEGLPPGLEGSPSGPETYSLSTDSIRSSPEAYYEEAGPESLVAPSSFQPRRDRRDSDRPESTSKANRPLPNEFSTSDPASSIREYAYLLLAFALIPLVFSLLGQRESKPLMERIEASLENASPDEVRRVEAVLSNERSEMKHLLAALPGGKFLGAHLAHDSMMHWAYAGIAIVGFLLLTMLFFSVERVNPMYLLGVGLFTGTIGIVLLLVVQFCSQIRLGGFRGGGKAIIVILILYLIGLSYRSALDPDNNFILSALGFTFGVGLCEELTKAIPLFFYFKRDASMGWRGACLCGLASGIGFGVSEGIMYSADHYNGLSGPGIYVVRFVSCVALHAMWAASVGIAIAQRIDEYESITESPDWGLFMLKVLAVPMLLHGLYDTLLKKEMNLLALGIAIVSFFWLAWQVEHTRAAHPKGGCMRARKRKAAYY